MIRIGSVPYLNSKALVYGLQASTPRYTLEFDVPSALARKLRAGELDVALASSIEYFRNPGYQIVSGISISAHREMWSIQLFHRTPLKQARRIGTDPSSETTNALLQVILLEKLHLGIELAPLQTGENPVERTDLDGFLKIGDPCLTFVPPPGYHAVDLAAEWYEFTRMPFVFAVWLVRTGVELEGINQDLFSAKREGLRNIEAIARAEGPPLGMNLQRAKTYIGKIVRYDLGREEIGGLDLFRRYLVRQRLVPAGQGFEFYTR